MFNKKIVLSILTLTMLAALGSAGTWAYFQSTATGTSNIHAGTVDLSATYGGSATTNLGNIALPNLVPGDSGYMKLGHVENSGTAPGELWMKIVKTSGTNTNDLEIYAVNPANNAIISANLNKGGDVDLGAMAAKVGTVAGTKDPVS